MSGISETPYCFLLLPFVDKLESGLALSDAPGICLEPEVPAEDPADEPAVPIDDEPDEFILLLLAAGVGLELDPGLPVLAFGSFFAANAGAIENIAIAAAAARKGFMAFLQSLFQSQHAVRSYVPPSSYRRFECRSE
jgi:hypothetical protein